MGRTDPSLRSGLGSRLEPPKTGVSKTPFSKRTIWKIPWLSSYFASLTAPVVVINRQSFAGLPGECRRSSFAKLPEEARNGASRDDPVSWRFEPGYWVGRLGRLAVLARLPSEVEARFLAGTVPHSRRNFWQLLATLSAHILQTVRRPVTDQTIQSSNHQNRDGRVLGHVGGLAPEVPA